MLEAELVREARDVVPEIASWTAWRPAPSAGRSTPYFPLTKRCFDLAAAVIAAVFLSPLLLGVGLLVRAGSPGPALFRQRRVGRGGVTFTMLKFRTMRAEQSDEFCRVQTSRGDPRVTRLGAFLRRTSLDELPQLFNVLAGEMSMVGPRPHALGTSVAGLPLEDADARYPARHQVRPGITGLAQVSFCRGELDCVEKLRRRVAFDLDYIETWSWGLDLRIMARTLRTMLFHNGAY